MKNRTTAKIKGIKTPFIQVIRSKHEKRCNFEPNN